MNDFWHALKAFQDAAAAQRADLLEMAGSAEHVQDELQRSQDESQATRAELQQAQQHLRVAQVSYEVVRAELDETKVRSATAEATKLTVEAHNTKLRDEVQKLLGIVADQQGDITRLQSANDNIRLRIRRGFASAASLLLVAFTGIAAWMSWSQALAH